MNKLAVIVLGQPDSGKSTTWYKLFGGGPGRIIQKSRNKHLKLSSGEFIHVILITRSPEEDRNFWDDLKSGAQPIILCSLQYSHEARRVLNYLIGEEFQLYVQRINPGYGSRDAEVDHLRIWTLVRSADGMFLEEDGNKLSARVEKIREFISKWV